jgi:phage terminase large subunit-like protein
MLVTNSDGLAKKFSSACRNLCGTELEIDREAAWKIRGVESLNFSYHASGVRGQLSGHGATILLFDDLVKNGAEAKSDVVRDAIWDGVVSAALNRLSPDGIVVAMQARLHQDDPLGRLLALDHMDWMHLRLPAINTGGQAWFRDGENETLFPPYDSLWPERYGPEKLAGIRAAVSPYYFNAEFLCTPSMGDLACFDVEKCAPYQGAQCETCWIAVDAANTETKSGSFTAMVCLGLHQGILKVLSVRRGRWRQDVVHAELQGFFNDMSALTGRRPERIIVERAAAGYGIIDALSWKLPIEPLIPRGSKEERAAAVCYLINRGQVALPDSAPWLKAFKDELQNFPLCSTNDQVDAFVHALSYPARPSEFKPCEQSEVVMYDPVAHHGGRFELDDIDDQLDRALRGTADPL